MICEECKGSGKYVGLSKIEECERCRGTGYLIESVTHCGMGVGDTITVLNDGTVIPTGMTLTIDGQVIPQLTSSSPTASNVSSVDLFNRNVFRIGEMFAYLDTEAKIEPAKMKEYCEALGLEYKPKTVIYIDSQTKS